MKKQISLLFFVLVHCNFLFAQQTSLLDSLKNILFSSLADSAKFQRIVNFSTYVLKNNAPDPINLFSKGIVLLKESKIKNPLNENIEALFTKFKGDAIDATASSDEAGNLEYYIKAEKMFEETGNTYWQANMHRLIGRHYYLSGNHKKGYAYLEETKVMAEKSGDKRILLKYLWTSEDLADREMNYKKALDYQLQLLPLSIELKDSSSIATCYQNLADLNSKLGNYNVVLNYSDLALKWFTVLKDSDYISWVYLDRGNHFARMGNSKMAIENFKKSIDIDKRLKILYLLRLNYESLTKEYELMKDYKNALEYYKLASALRDSATINLYTAKSAEMEAKYDLEKKDNEIILLDKDEKLQKAEAEKQRNLRNNIAITSLFVMSLAVFAFYNFRNRIKQKQEKERARISRDLHDDVGATLSSISIFSEAANQKLKNKNADEAGNLLERISTDAQEMVSVMSDFVWTISPANDSFQRLVDRIQTFASPVLSAKNIRMNFDADETLNSLSLKPEVRKNIFLIFKEAINNAAKYSNSTEVSLTMKNGNRNFEMTIADNGTGFDTSVSSQGNGMRNMKSRAEEINAVMKINSDKNGTRITVSVPSP